MIKTLTGKNAYTINQLKRETVDEHIRIYGDISLVVLSGEVEDIRTVHGALTTLPFLVERNLVVLDRPSENSALVEKLPKWLEQKNESTNVLIVEPTLDKRTAWAKFLASSTDYIDCVAMDERTIGAWFKEETNRRGIEITPGAQQLLLRYAGIDQLRLSQELNKLRDHGGTIDTAQIKELVEPSLEESIFHLLDNVVRGNTRGTYSDLDDLTKRGTSAHQVVTMIGWQVANLAMIAVFGGESADTVARKTGLHPYVVRKNQQLARSIGLQNLRLLLEIAVDAELRIKRDGQKAERVVEMLIAEVTRVVKNESTS